MAHPLMSERAAAAAGALCLYRHHPAELQPESCRDGCADCRASAVRVVAAWNGATGAAQLAPHPRSASEAAGWPARERIPGE